MIPTCLGQEQSPVREKAVCSTGVYVVGLCSFHKKTSGLSSLEGNRFFMPVCNLCPLMKCTRNLRPQNMVSFGQVERAPPSCLNIKDAFENSVRPQRFRKSFLAHSSHCRALALSAFHDEEIRNEWRDLGYVRRYPQSYCIDPKVAKKGYCCVCGEGYLTSRSPLFQAAFPPTFSSIICYISIFCGLDTGPSR